MPAKELENVVDVIVTNRNYSGKHMMIGRRFQFLGLFPVLNTTAAYVLSEVF